AGLPNPTSASSLVYDSTQFDANTTSESFTITVSLTATCVSNASITISVNQVVSGGSSSQPPLVIGCTVTGGGSSAGAGQIAITARRNALVCGGTTTLKATARDGVTGVDDPHVYHFQTDIGQILQQSDNSAILALLPGQLSATVTATTVAIPLNASLDAN